MVNENIIKAAENLLELLKVTHTLVGNFVINSPVPISVCKNDDGYNIAWSDSLPLHFDKDILMVDLSKSRDVKAFLLNSSDIIYGISVILNKTSKELKKIDYISRSISN